MSTNVLNIPQIPPGTVITIASADDWRDQIYVSAFGLSAAPIILSGALSGDVLTVASADSVVPGMLALGYGLPMGVTVTAVSGTQITLSAPATISAPNASISFVPPPLDLTGISFASQIRATVPANAIILSASTAAGTMTNGAAEGTFGWNVPAATMAATPWPTSLRQQGSESFYLDVVASDASGAKVNLCQAGPITLNVNLSVTR